MPAPPLVSIIMPTLNQARFIKAAINSVLQQDYQNIELIICDGGSSDATCDLVQNLAVMDNRLSWHSSRDTGPAEALNTGFKMAKGSILGWLNSDDLYAPGAVTHAVEDFASNENIIMLYGHGEHIDIDGKSIAPYPTKLPDTPVDQLADGCFICQPTVFFTREMYSSLGQLDNSLKTAFDYDYWIRAFLAFPSRIGFIDRLQAKSRLHNECITMSMRIDVARESIKIVARHFGKAPEKWLLFLIRQASQQPNDTRNGAPLADYLRSQAKSVAQYVDPEVLQSVLARIEADPGFALRSEKSVSARMKAGLSAIRHYFQIG